MSLIKELQKKIKKHQATIETLNQDLQGIERQKADLEKKLYGETLALNQLEELYDSVPPVTKNQEHTKTLRAGSDLEKARNAILKHGKALHVSDILKAIGKEDIRESRSSLAGTLNSYANKRRIFTKEGPGIYGLIEFENGNGDEIENENDVLKVS